MMGQFYKSNGTKNGKLKKGQYKYFTSDEGLEVAKEWIIEKILNQRIHLLYDFIEKYRILALEGTFDLFNNKMIKDEYFLGDTLKALSLEGKYAISTYFNNIFELGREYQGKKYRLEDIVRFEIKKLKNKILETEL